MQNVPGILYLMHVPWGWIKQRPQYIAEQLDASDAFVVRVCHEAIYRTGELTHSQPALKTPVRTLPALPLRRLRVVRRLNAFLHRMLIRRAVRISQVIWLTHPRLIEWIPESHIGRRVVVYDCMDDELRSPLVSRDPAERTRLEVLERRLVQRADVIFASAGTLRTALMERHGVSPEKIHVVNNALALPSAGPTPAVPPHLEAFLGHIRAMGRPTIMYIGTIGPWVDFDLVLSVLSLQPELAFAFVGPVETAIPRHERLVHCPPIPHGNVSSAMSAATALIMPFKLDEFIRSVNPVKAYEYIASGKPAFLVRYQETEKFAAHCELFSGAQELSSQITRLLRGERKTALSGPALEAFVTANNWEARSAMMRQKVAACLSAEKP